MKLISIIIPTYKNSDFLEETLKSIFKSSYHNFEIILVDDHSPAADFKSIEKIAKSFKSDKIKIIRKEINGGPGLARNTGIENSLGEYIAFIDADDLMEKNRLEIQVEALENGYDIVGSLATKINEKGEKIGEMNYPPKEDADIKKYSCLHSPFITSSVMFKKSLLGKDRFTKLRYAEDYELWTNLIYKGKAKNIDKRLISYRIHENQTTKNRFRLKTHAYLIKVISTYRYLKNKIKIN